MKQNPNFCPSEILCLELEDTFLYSEVIQVVTDRQLCWVRPLALKVLPAIAPIAATASPTVYDLRQGADLFCPSGLFRAALDVEVIPLLMELGESKLQVEVDRLARHQLQTFIQRVWQAYPSAFGQVKRAWETEESQF